jgi:hypothetical protein
MNWTIFITGLIMTPIGTLITGIGWNWDKLNKNSIKKANLSFVIIGITFGLLGVLGITLGANWERFIKNEPREIDRAEVSRTTRFEESLILDYLNDSDERHEKLRQKLSSIPLDDSHMEQFAQVRKELNMLDELAIIENAYNSMKDYLNTNHIQAIDEGDPIILMFNEDNILKGREIVFTAEKPAAMNYKNGSFLGSSHLTKKGIELARDLLYLRRHPNVHVYRPAEDTQSVINRIIFSQKLNMKPYD